VRQALASAVPPPRKAYPPRPQPAFGAYAAVIDGWLLADRDAPRKQRHTAQRVWQRLVAEHGAPIASTSTVAAAAPSGSRPAARPASNQCQPRASRHGRYPDPAPRTADRQLSSQADS